MNNEKNVTLLVVDDDDDLLILFWLAMRARGYQVEVSKNAETFWDDIFTVNPDVIILDIHMPGIDGRLLCKELKDHKGTSDIPVILLSANADLENIAQDTGADAFIRKPFVAEQVTQMIDRVLFQVA